MIGMASGTRVWLVAGHTDMSKGFDGLAAVVQTALAENPFDGHVFAFCGRRGDIIKVPWFDDQEFVLQHHRCRVEPTQAGAPSRARQVTGIANENASHYYKHISPQPQPSRNPRRNRPCSSKDSCLGLQSSPPVSS